MAAVTLSSIAQKRAGQRNPNNPQIGKRGVAPSALGQKFRISQLQTANPRRRISHHIKAAEMVSYAPRWKDNSNTEEPARMFFLARSDSSSMLAGRLPAVPCPQ